MATLSEIRKYLAAHDYLARVKHIDSGCILNVPVKVFGTALPFRERVYAYNRKRNCLHVRNDEEKTTVDFEIPQYAARLAIWCDLSIVMQQMNYSLSCVQVVDADDKDVSDCDDFASVAPNFIDSEENRQKETVLSEIFMQALEMQLNGSFHEMAQQHGVVEGYERLCLILRG